MINQRLNSCPASTTTMKNPILWEKNGVLDLGNKPKSMHGACTVRAQIKQHPFVARFSCPHVGHFCKDLNPTSVCWAVLSWSRCLFCAALL